MNFIKNFNPSKHILLKFLLLFSIPVLTGVSNQPDCGDGTTYANREQTKHDKRFHSFKKIKSVPEFLGEYEEFNHFILANYIKYDVAQSDIQLVEYQFTITCEGKLKGLKCLGEGNIIDWPIIEEIILNSRNKWKPATKSGLNVDCIFFNKIVLNGNVNW